ncbi:DUF134 domain-containing protein [Candidatus Bipolaricaulota bacterium]|nr:DUF134 domain-containing protein [Candidatus Bipolaricaulota bacterium]
MPRPFKPRWCERIPPRRAFKPVGVPMGRLEEVILLLDELEALRLCDLVGLDQEVAGQRMGVSRGTVQRLLAAGRAKVVDALVHGKGIVLSGGDHIRLPPGHHGWGHRGGRGTMGP